MCPERLIDIQKLEANRRNKLGIRSFSPNVVQDESWATPKVCAIQNGPEQHNDKNFEFFEAAILSLDIHDSDSGWYLNFGATQHMNGNRSNFTNLDQFSGSV